MVFLRYIIRITRYRLSINEHIELYKVRNIRQFERLSSRSPLNIFNGESSRHIEDIKPFSVINFQNQLIYRRMCVYYTFI